MRTTEADVHQDGGDKSKLTNYGAQSSMDQYQAKKNSPILVKESGKKVNQSTIIERSGKQGRNHTNHTDAALREANRSAADHDSAPIGGAFKKIHPDV